jgi:hypothetical protein
LHGVQRGERRRILSVRFLHHALARLLEDDAAAERVVLEEEARRAELAGTRRLEGAVGESAGALHGDVAQNGWMDHFVHEADLQRASRPHRSAGENHVERCLQSDSSRQALRSAHSRNESQLDFRQGKRRLRMVGADAIAASEGELESSAYACTVNRRDGGNAKFLQTIDPFLSKSAQTLGVLVRAEIRELFDVGAGDEHIGFAGDEHQSLDEEIARHADEDLLELGGERGAQRVDRLVRLIDRDDEDVARERGRQRLSVSRGFGDGAHARSMTMAWPMPPAAQDRHQPELSAAAYELVGERHENASSRRPEWMSDRDRATHHIELRPVDLTDRVGESGALGPIARQESSEVAQHLRGERLVHLDEIDVGKRQSRALQRRRRGEHGAHEQLLARIERRVGVGPDVREWL